MAHAVLGAIEAQVTGNHALAGAAGAVAGELSAKIITEKLYNKTPDKLTESEKQTVATLSQIAGGLTGGLVGDSTGSGISSAGIATRAVENNFLSNAEDERLFNLSKTYNERGWLSSQEQNEVVNLLLKDYLIDKNIMKYQSDPSSLTEQQRRDLDLELHKIAHSYGFPVETLYNLDFSHRITRDDRNLLSYLKTQGAIKNSFTVKLGESLYDGLNLMTLAYGGLNAPKVIAETGSILKAMNSAVSGSTKIAIGVGATGSVTSQLLTEGKIDPKVLALDVGTAYITKDKGLAMVVGVNVLSGGLSAYVTDNSVYDGALASGIGSTIGYGVGKNKFCNEYNLFSWSVFIL
ncbi:VENN motif pre-toxin domain-containing protein [Otariodibacter oris]|uniref:VENN motif-containing pre-toxin protein n=1 Tax=Otariodibacter oris TaxID=1032623 RepID=A0A420XIA3_9PAST|nr:VENN motif pre-toxin domain-containing protein [Otariodibacter oris]QGM80838.1 hypothetical protein A6A10_05190 [Otariodibacter oris]RKR76989.1 VENN motif-containing pre-toxin protein [Otariodibacter oris]